MTPYKALERHILCADKLDVQVPYQEEAFTKKPIEKIKSVRINTSLHVRLSKYMFAGIVVGGSSTRQFIDLGYILANAKQMPASCGLQFHIMSCLCALTLLRREPVRLYCFDL